uniref:Uncharacterized protein n=1 Tax=Arundo donax TaxID=35708 RepID=A0A0A9AT16_ARUDO
MIPGKDRQMCPTFMESLSRWSPSLSRSRKFQLPLRIFEFE